MRVCVCVCVCLCVYVLSLSLYCIYIYKYIYIYIIDIYGEVKGTEIEKSWTTSPWELREEMRSSGEELHDDEPLEA